MLVRIDADVPIKHRRTVDGPHGRIARAAVGLQWLRQKGAKIIVLTHLGRPNGKTIAAYSARPVAKRLTDLMGVPVKFSRQIVGSEVEQQVSRLQNGEILLLENLRFEARERTNSPAFARQLARLGDLYVNDAFANAHRAHASMEALASELPAYAGPLLAHQVQLLSRVLKHPRKPFVVFMGGLKVADKLPVLKKLLPHVDVAFVGGALATTCLVAKGLSVGKSVYDTEGIAAATQLIKHKKIRLPNDVVVVSRLSKQSKRRVVPVSEIGPNDVVADVGPEFLANCKHAMTYAKLILWNGPFGYCECAPFCAGTETLARSIVARTGRATTIIGGGDTGPVIESLGLADKVTLFSTGGGAMLEFLSGKELPGIAPLIID